MNYRKHQNRAAIFCTDCSGMI